MRQLLTESVILALVGGAVGLALAFAGAGIVRQFPVPPAAGRPDLRVLGFALLASAVTGILFGLAPALRASRSRPAAGLKDTRPGAGSAAGRLPGALVATQVAISLVLLVGAGLFLRSLRAVVNIDAGLDMDRLVVASVDLGSAGYAAADRSAFYDRAVERVAALPGVEAASVVIPQPLSGSAWGLGIHGFDGESPDVEEGPYGNIVAPGYFRATGTPILRGRGFTDADRRGAEPVAVVNERLARELAPGGTVVGRCIAIRDQREDGGCTRIVGVAADVRHRYLYAEPVPYVYRPSTQLPFGEVSFFTPLIVARAEGDPGDVLSTVQPAVQGLAPDLPYVEVQRLEATLGPQVLPFRIGAALFTAFGLLALLLAAVGLYGVLAYLVARRTREVGVRMALGATRGEVVRLVVRQGLRPVAIGAVLGTAGALAGTRLLSALLHDVSVRDPLAFGAAVAVLSAVALFASWLPARRAARVDPMIALRVE